MKTDQTVSVSGPQEGGAGSGAIWILMPGFVRLENKNQRKLFWGKALIGHLDLNQTLGEGARERQRERERERVTESEGGFRASSKQQDVPMC